MIRYSGKRFIIIICLILFILIAPQILFAQEEGYWRFSHREESIRNFNIEQTFREKWVNTYSRHPYIHFDYYTQTFGHRDGERVRIRDYRMNTRTLVDHFPEVMIPGEEYAVRFSTEVLHAENPSRSGGPAPSFFMTIIQCRSSVPAVADIHLDFLQSGTPNILRQSYTASFTALHDRYQGHFGQGGRSKGIRQENLEQGLKIEDEFVLTAPEYTPESPEMGFLLMFGYPHSGYALYWYIYNWVSDKDQIEKMHPAVHAVADPREVRPDGESTIDISATLYEYIPGDDASSTPLAGETVTFEISEIEGIRPGRLSSATAATGADGIAQVTYTAPTADELKTIEEFRRHNITVKIRSEKHNVDDLAYITIRPQRGKAFIEPSIDGLLGTAYGGSRGIVPPDGRFPAMIRAVLEDENMKPLKNAEVTVTILSEEPVGMIRSIDGVEAVTLDLVTDDRGRIEAHYFYALETPPEVPVKETIQITSDFMTTPLEVEVSVGLNMVIDNVESAYEGRGVVNAGENIPLRIRVKDIWNPDIDLSEIITYWGLGEGTGDTRLFIRLEIDNISSIPEYVMDHFRQTFYPEPPFDQRVEIISSERLAQKNLLWVPDYSLLPYRGYPRVRPVATGNHYYEARISLVDHHGEVVFETDYPATKGFFNLHTDMPADEIYLYFVNNPLRPQTEGAEYLAIALDWLGAGCVVSVVDALDAINRGDTDALFSIMFSEIRGFFMDQAKEMSSDFKQIITHYSRLSFADRITDQIQQSITLRSGDTKERLFNLLEKEFADAGGTLVMFTDRNEPGFPDVPVHENKLHYDAETGIASLQSGDRFFFILPEELLSDEHRPYTRASSATTAEDDRAAVVASPANDALLYNEHITLSSDVFASDESISLTWHNLPGSRTDWICVVPADASDRTFGSLWWYTSGEESGIRDIGSLPEGVYEVRVYYDWPRGSYRVESRLRFSVK